MLKAPWDGYIEPGKIFGNIYFVGTRPASTHVIDTGDGYILIDPGYQESLYLVLHNMWKIGLDPLNIKMIVMSHGHYDHAGGAAALKELTGADIYMSAEDVRLTDGSLDRSYFYGTELTFVPDHTVGDGDVIALGNTEITCVSTPGHTDGTISFFFDVTDGERTYRAGMHGGVGINTLTKEYLDRTGTPYKNRDIYLASLEKVRGQKVELHLGNHCGNNDTPGKLDRVRAGETDAFIDPTAWDKFLDKCKAKLLKKIEEENSAVNN